MISRLHAIYRKTAVPELKKELSVVNTLAVPTITRIVVNVGFGKHLKDNQHQPAVLKTLERITGQKPLLTKSKKSIASFKVRQGMVIGAKVTLRGEQMWEFLDKLIHVTLARVRDFHGIDPKSFGGRPAITIGIREHTAFPEIRSDEVEHIHGLEVTIITNAKDQAAAKLLLTKLGFPFTSSTT